MSKKKLTNIQFYEDKINILLYIDVNDKCNSCLNFSKIMEPVWYWTFQIRVQKVVVKEKKN